MKRQEVDQALAAAWDEIEEGAQRRLNENKQRLQELYTDESKPTLVGHVEEMLVPKTDDDPERPLTSQPKSIFEVETEDQLKQVLGEQAEMDKRDERVNKAPSHEASDIDLESEMEKQMGTQETEKAGEKPRDPASGEQQESTPAKSTDQRDPAGTSAQITAEAEVHESEYGKLYRTGPQEREIQNAARLEKQKNKEEALRKEREKQEAMEAALREQQERDRQVVEKALLEEEERQAKEALAKLCHVSKDKKKTKTDAERKKKKQRLEEEEEEEQDDEDHDPDYNPDKDPDRDFIDDESVMMDDKDVIEVEKHSHVINFKESGEYTVWIRDNLVELEEAVRVGGGVAERSYVKFLELLKDGIMKMETYSPIEGADVKQVVKTIVDLSCCAWRKKMRGVKTGNCRTIMRAEEKKEQVLKAAENKDIPEDADAVLGEDLLKGKSPEDQCDIKMTIKRFFQHVAKSHEEAACAAGKLAELVDVLDPDEFGTIARAGTRPILIMEFPEVKKLVEQKRDDVKKAEIREELKNTPIDEIVALQNLPTPLERWKDSKILLPTRYLAMATHFFVYSQAVQNAPMTNKFVAKKFNVSLSTLHRITSGRRYAGGHETAKSQAGEHGEVTVKVVKKKKEKGKVAVTKVPIVVSGEIDESTPVQGLRKRRCSSRDDDEKED